MFTYKLQLFFDTNRFKHINESLCKNCVPFELVDGFIGNIVVHIPYSKLLQDSCTIEITGLEITLQPKPRKSTDLGNQSHINGNG